jgi:molybdopterin converting factor small subunit
MSIEVYFPPSLQSMVNDLRHVSVTGSTLGDCLDQVIQEYPQLREAIFGLNQTLNKKLSYFINGENAHPEMLKRIVRDGDKVFIMDILVGG